MNSENTLELIDLNNSKQNRGVYFVPKLYNCPKVRQARDENFIIAPYLHVAHNEIS